MVLDLLYSYHYDMDKVRDDGARGRIIHADHEVCEKGQEIRRRLSLLFTAWRSRLGFALRRDWRRTNSSNAIQWSRRLGLGKRYADRHLMYVVQDDEPHFIKNECGLSNDTHLPFQFTFHRSLYSS